MTVSERIPFSGLLLPLQKGYTYVFASFNSIMVGVLMVAIAVYVCVGLPNMNPGQLVLADMFSSGTKLPPSVRASRCSHPRSPAARPSPRSPMT